MSESHEYSKKLRIRTLGESEWEVLREVRLRAVKDSPQAFGDSFDATRSRDEKTWRMWLKNATVYAALIGNEPVATVTFRKDIDDVWIVNGVWTDPASREKGLSKKLFEYVLRDARAQGIDSIQLNVNSTQEAALRMYESLGFSVIRNVPDQRWGDGSIFDGVIMEKKLM